MTIYASQAWSFNNANELTAPNILEASIGSAVLLQMDFENVISPDVALDENTTPTVTVTDIVGSTEPTLSNKRVSYDRKSVLVDVALGSATAETYTFAFTPTTTDGQTPKRYGRLVVS